MTEAACEFAQGVSRLEQWRLGGYADCKLPLPSGGRNPNAFLAERTSALTALREQQA